ncbi:MAG: two-component regulator propeller domain-containing protein, partial [Candidatus Korobacteraceae bacterium]
MHDIAHLKGGVAVSHFELPGIQQFQRVSEDPDGSLWVVRWSLSVTNQPLCHISDQATRCFGESDGIPISAAASLLRDNEGGFWMGGLKGIVYWRDGVSQVYPIKLKPHEPGTIIRSMLPGPDGSLWVGIMEDAPGRGLERLKNGVFQTFVAAGFDGSTVEVYSMTFDRDGSLWIGTAGKGLFRVHGEVVEHYGQAEGLSSDNVRDLFEDREGILWVATNNGIDCFRDPRVTSFSTSEGLGNAAAGVLASKDGTIWVANDGSLDHIVNGSVSSIRYEHGLPGGQVTSLLEDSAGNLWVGVDHDLYLFKDGHFRQVSGPNHEPLGFVSAMTEDVDGNVWAECFGATPKLVRIRDFQVREEFPAPQTPFGHSMAPDPRGGIWIATTKKGDLGHFRDGTMQLYPLNLSSPLVTHLGAAADGSVYAATVDGLVGLRQGKVQRLTTKNGLPCDSVISFIQDKEKRWWLYTNCGVVEFPDSELQRWWSNPEGKIQTRVFDVLDGARPSGRPSFNAAALSSNGRLWFASGAVVQKVDPARLSQEALPAATYIESVVVDRKEFAATEGLKLSPHPRDLQIDYTSPTFLIPQRVKFRYKLDHYDRDWHDAGTRRQAFYTDLPPGKYSFRVIASNSDGVWNDSAAKLDFSVAPAYYQTNWFRALCAVFFMALLWTAYQLRVRQLHHQFEMTLDA